MTLKFKALCLLLIGSTIYSFAAYELSIAAIFKNEGPYLKEWIEYHRMAGVEHFWLYNDASEDNWQEVLQPYIHEKMVEVINWPVPSFPQFIVCQVNAYRDALIRTQGKTKWLALIDIDEFLIPLTNNTIPECLAQHFPDASAIYVNWHNFGTGGLSLSQDEPILFHLTAASIPSHSRNSIGKTIVRPDRTRPQSLWNPHHCVLQPDCQYYNGDAQPIPFMEDVQPNLDGLNHNKFLRINHYVFRDENFFKNVRLVRVRKWNLEEPLVWQHYKEFCEVQDHTIINYIQEKHPDMYEKFWKNSHLSRK